MKVKASLKHFRMSPRKVRLVADLIRGLDVAKAQEQLTFLNKRAAANVLKLLNSAIANAENNFKLEKDNLFVATITVDGGPVLKRWLPRAHGRATPLLKRTSHINIILDERASIKTKIVTKTTAEPAKGTTDKPQIDQAKESDIQSTEESKKGSGRTGWQEEKKSTGQKGFGGAVNKIFRRKSF